MRTRDFTLDAYEALLHAIAAGDYRCITFHDYCTGAKEYNRQVILRHDVDLRPRNALRMAEMEARHSIPATYYFRIVPASLDRDIVRAVAGLGHEIGYHYEDLSLARGDHTRAIKLFEEHLKWFEDLAPVTTICMHGSPLSRWDNRDLWKHYDYKSYGLLGEPYLVMDFDQWFYLTDTGMHWNRSDVSVRDKVSSSFTMSFAHTYAIADAFERKAMPDHVLINTHPQRWNDSLLAWTIEASTQQIKNRVKRLLVR